MSDIKTIQELMDLNYIKSNYSDITSESEQFLTIEDSISNGITNDETDSFLVLDGSEEVFKSNTINEILSRVGDKFVKYNTKSHTYTYCVVDDKKKILRPTDTGVIEIKEKGEKDMPKITETKETIKNKSEGSNVKKPETPETPKTPETPETPKTPETPETPKTPETPDTPKTPETHKTPEAPKGPATPNAPSVPTAPTQKMTTYTDGNSKAPKTDAEKAQAKLEKERKLAEREAELKAKRAKIEKQLGKDVKEIDHRLLVRNGIKSEILCYLVTKPECIALRTSNKKVEDPATKGKEDVPKRAYRIATSTVSFKVEKDESESWYSEKSFVFRSVAPSPFKGALLKVPVDIFDGLNEDYVYDEAIAEKTEVTFQLLTKEEMYSIGASLMLNQEFKEASYMSDGGKSAFRIVIDTKDSTTNPGETELRLKHTIAGRPKLISKNNYLPQKMFDVIDIAKGIPADKIGQVNLSLASKYLNEQNTSFKSSDESKFEFIPEHKDFLQVDPNQPVDKGITCKAITGKPINIATDSYFSEVNPFYLSGKEAKESFVTELPVVLKSYQENSKGTSVLKEDKVYDIANYDNLTEVEKTKLSINNDKFQDIMDLEDGAVGEFLTADLLKTFFASKGSSTNTGRTNNVSPSEARKLIQKAQNGKLKTMKTNLLGMSDLNRVKDDMTQRVMEERLSDSEEE